MFVLTKENMNMVRHDRACVASIPFTRHNLGEGPRNNPNRSTSNLEKWVLQDPRRPFIEFTNLT